MDSDEEYLHLNRAYSYEDLTFLEACLDANLDAIQSIAEENPTEEEVNERDRSGRTGFSHICANGITPALELITDVPEIDVNLPDKEGNTPLIFAAQAGHTDAVRIILQEFKNIRIDQTNRFGLTALMKAGIQGRVDCARLLLYAGADPNLRDTGRNLCADEWARYCGRKTCADAIAKFSNTKWLSFHNRQINTKSINSRTERANSLPDLCAAIEKQRRNPQTHKRSYFLHKKILKLLPGRHDNSKSLSVTDVRSNAFAMIARCLTSPVLSGMQPLSYYQGQTSRPKNVPRLEFTTSVDDSTDTVTRITYPCFHRRRRLRSKLFNKTNSESVENVR